VKKEDASNEDIQPISNAIRKKNGLSPVIKRPTDLDAIKSPAKEISEARRQRKPQNTTDNMTECMKNEYERILEPKVMEKNKLRKNEL